MASLEQHRLLVEKLRRLNHGALCIEDGSVGQTSFNQSQAHQTVVDTAESWPGEFYHVDFEPILRQMVGQRCHKRLGLFMEMVGSVNEVDTQHPKGFLIFNALFSPQLDMDQDLRSRGPYLMLKANTDPPLTILLS